jgi:hypothetical protein
MSETTTVRFAGHANRECGDHHSTGHRAWCFNCSEWCYEDIPCKGCELPSLRAAVQSLLNAQGRMLDDWAEANEDRRRELWRRLHEEADCVRALLVANTHEDPAVTG